jgi:hypothetical protein
MWEISQPWKQLTYVFNAMENGDFVMWSPKVKLRVVDSARKLRRKILQWVGVSPHKDFYVLGQPLCLDYK